MMELIERRLTGKGGTCKMEGNTIDGVHFTDHTPLINWELRLVTDYHESWLDKQSHRTHIESKTHRERIDAIRLYQSRRWKRSRSNASWITCLIWSTYSGSRQRRGRAGSRMQLPKKVPIRDFVGVQFHFPFRNVPRSIFPLVHSFLIRFVIWLYLPFFLVFSLSSCSCSNLFFVGKHPRRRQDQSPFFNKFGSRAEKDGKFRCSVDSWY